MGTPKFMIFAKTIPANIFVLFILYCAPNYYKSAFLDMYVSQITYVHHHHYQYQHCYQMYLTQLYQAHNMDMWMHH